MFHNCQPLFKLLWRPLKKNVVVQGGKIMATEMRWRQRFTFSRQMFSAQHNLQVPDLDNLSSVQVFRSCCYSVGSNLLHLRVWCIIRAWEILEFTIRWYQRNQCLQPRRHKYKNLGATNLGRKAFKDFILLTSASHHLCSHRSWSPRAMATALKLNWKDLFNISRGSKTLK